MSSSMKQGTARASVVRYEVTRKDLPLHCPTDQSALWSMHPRVYLPIEQTGVAKCPYCGAEYLLKDHAEKR